MLCPLQRLSVLMECHLIGGSFIEMYVQKCRYCKQQANILNLSRKCSCFMTIKNMYFVSHFFLYEPVLKTSITTS